MEAKSRFSNLIRGSVKVQKIKATFRRVPPRNCGLTEEEYATMNDVDENGWGHIHHAAFRGFVKSVEKFVKAGNDMLELETGDDLHSTPLLLAVMSGNMETVEMLVQLGAKVNAINSQNHGVVELCAFKQYIELLKYFIDLDHEKLPVWKILIKFLSSESDEEAEAAGRCLRELTQKVEEELNPNWEPAFKFGIVPAIIKVLKGSISDDTKIQCFHVLLNLISNDDIKEQAASSGGIPVFIKLLKSNNNYMIQLSAEVLKEICVVKKLADQAAQNGAIPSLVKVIQTVSEPEAICEVVDALGNITDASETHRGALNHIQGAISSIVKVFEGTSHRSLLHAMTRSICKMVKVHEPNQTAFVNEGVVGHIVTLTRINSKTKDLQLSAVECIQKLSENNPYTQRTILNEGIVMPLMQLLTKSRQQNLQEKTACALWSLAGEEDEERRSMATMMRVQTLVEFLSSLSESLHFIGSEGLGVLATGPLNHQSAIAQANGIHPLVRLLRSDKEHIVLSVVKTLRALCVGVGFVPHLQNQLTIAQSRGIKFLVALMVHSRNELIQVEAAYALGCISLGNPENLEEIQQNMDFSYVRILKMMYCEDEEVRLLASAALAAFAYNDLSQQKEIAEQGGVRFGCFVEFLRSNNEYHRCMAAFQVIVLSRIIPDEEQAQSSASGIKLLVDLLHDSKSDAILALTADCIARLAHTRAGVPAAFVSIDSVNLLCNLMQMPSEQVRGCAAIALGYLSYNHAAKRQLLNRCRLDPYLMKLLTNYTSRTKLSTEFREGWKHYKQIGLPPIDKDKTSLVGKKNVTYKEYVRPMTMDDSGSASNFQNNSIHDDNQTCASPTERSERASRASNRSVSRRSVGSFSSQRSGHQSLLSNELPAEMMAE